MSIADINRMQALYANQSEAEANAWKIPFEIANSFANVTENHRKLDENMQTKDWRIAFNNAINQANTAKEQLNLTKTQGEQQGLTFLQQNAVDENGRVRTPEELMNISRQNPAMNPYLFSQLLANNQNYAANTAKEIAPINPSLASSYRVMGGLSPFMLDQNNGVTNFETDVQLGKLPNGIDPVAYGGGNSWQNYFDNLKLQQEQQKTLEAAVGKTEQKLEERQYQQGIDQAKTLTKAFETVYSGAQKTDESGNKTGVLDPTLFRQQVQQLYLLYPSQVNAINDFVTRTVTQNGWK